MKKEILTQRFNYGVITVFKDYCRIPEKPADKKSMDELGPICGSTVSTIDDNYSFRLVEPEDVDQFRFFLSDHYDSKNKKIGETLFLHGKKWGKKRNTKYFYNEEDFEEKVQLNSLQKNSHFTTSDRQIKRHYGNPFSNIHVKLIERTIKVEGDKICVRVYQHSKSRQVNCKFFKRRKTSSGFTFNLKTGNFITYDTSGEMKTFRQNSFIHLGQIIKTLFESSSLTNNVLGDNHPYSLTKTDALLKKELDDNEFSNMFFHLIGKHIKTREDFLFSSKDKKDDHSKQLHDWVMKLFIDVNNIKAPNSYRRLLMNWYPTKPFLKKNENKLIAAILDRLGLKTKSLIKLMHDKSFDIKKVLMLVKYFGHKDITKYLANIHPDFLSTRWSYQWLTVTGIETSYSHYSKPKEYELTNREKANLLKLINPFFGETKDLNTESFGRMLMNFFRELEDHFNMIEKIRHYIPETEMRATTQMEFHNEHIELSKIERKIRKGYTIQYTFEKRLIDLIEKPILNHISDETHLTAIRFYPVILKTDAEYSEEGSHMHHCVASYADSEGSLIVSIREDSPAGNERVTCEFNVKTKELVQAKSFCNAKPPKQFEKVIEELNNKILNFRGGIKSIGKEKIPLVINGIEVAKPPRDQFIDLMERLGEF